MAKSNIMYKCKDCGNTTVRKPMGKCAACGSFQNFEEIEETVGSKSSAQAGLKSAGAKKPVKKAFNISEINSSPIKRFATGIGELDRVLGGGFVDSEVVLFAGQPGAGKSSLSLRIAEKFAENGVSVLYSSGEESEHQIGLRAQRMKVSNSNIKIINETNLETLLGHIEVEKPKFLVVDSLQTLASTEISGSIGSVQQSKEAAHTLTRLAKREGISMILVNQIVKSGDFSGSEAIQHIVDATLMLDSDPDTPLKFLRATKNRFGDTTEVGVFQHAETGLEEVSDPSGVLLDSDSELLAGTALSFISEGIRQIPVEIQALVTTSNLPNPRKQFNGVNYNRGQIICAILDKFCKAKLYDNDVFVNTVSGIRVNDPLSDLATAAAILSSIYGKTPEVRTAFVGEMSLTGQIRGSFMIDAKIREADRLGFKRIVIPKSAKNIISPKHKIETVTISYISELAAMLK